MVKYVATWNIPTAMERAPRRMRVPLKLGIRALAVIVMLGCASMFAQAPAPLDLSSGVPRQNPPRKVKPKPAAPTPVAAAQPAAPLQVSYENGRLSISAKDAHLSDVLDRVRERTGAAIDVPTDMDERVDVQLGPGPAVQVISELLAATPFNYVIAAAPRDNGAVQSVQLTRKPSSPEEPPPPPTVSADDEDRAAAAQARMKANLTGGDEGVWDEVELPATPASPAASPVVIPPAAASPPPPAEGAASPK